MLFVCCSVWAEAVGNGYGMYGEGESVVGIGRWMMKSILGGVVVTMFLW